MLFALLEDSTKAGCTEAEAKELEEIFHGRLQHTVRCSVCGTLSLREEAFADLNLSFPVSEQKSFGTLLRDSL